MAELHAPTHVYNYPAPTPRAPSTVEQNAPMTPTPSPAVSPDSPSPANKTPAKGAANDILKLSPFEYISYDKLLSLYDQSKGQLFFIPAGFEPVLIPNGSQPDTVQDLLESARQVTNPSGCTPRILPENEVRLPSLALISRTEQAAKQQQQSSKAKPKKPPRPPNAFILYRRAKQPSIVAQHRGITNNEVSKEVGRMWHDEPAEVKLRFQRMAEAAKDEHKKKYPEYRYRPRKPAERKRRIRGSLSGTSGADADGTPSEAPSRRGSIDSCLTDQSFSRRGSCISVGGCETEYDTYREQLPHSPADELSTPSPAASPEYAAGDVRSIFGMDGFFDLPMESMQTEASSDAAATSQIWNFFPGQQQLLSPPAVEEGNQFGYMDFPGFDLETLLASGHNSCGAEYMPSPPTAPAQYPLMAMQQHRYQAQRSTV